MDIKKDSVEAHKRASDHIESLVKKLSKMSKEELEKTRKAVMKSMDMKKNRSMIKFTENDIQTFIRGHLKSYIAEIEKELEKRSMMK